MREQDACSSLDLQEHLTIKQSNKLQIKIPTLQGYSYHALLLFWKSKITSYPGQLFFIQPLPEGTDQANSQGHLPSTYLQNTQLPLPLQLSFNIFKRTRDLLWTGYFQKGKNTINYRDFFFSWKDFIATAMFFHMRSNKLKIYFPVEYLMITTKITSLFALIFIIAVNSKHCVNCVLKHHKQWCLFQSFFNYQINFHSHLKKMFLTRGFGYFSLKWQRKFRWIIMNQDKLWPQCILTKYCRSIKAIVTGIQYRMKFINTDKNHIKIIY